MVVVFKSIDMHSDILHHALRFYGLKEIVGQQHEQVILDMLDYIGFGYINDDETPWCSTFINYLAKKNGYVRSHELTARSWLKTGGELKSPRLGCIVVFSRGNPKGWQGHVGIYINENDTHIYCLGGNQKNEVNISMYPKSRLLGYRKLFKI